MHSNNYVFLVLDQMSVIVYSSCRIQFTLNNKQTPEREYSERSLLEVRESDNQSFVLRAVDIEHNRTEIFNFPIKDRNQYQFGLSDTQPDQINGSNGTYRIWLNKESRNTFHEIFRAMLEVFFPVKSSSDRITTSSTYKESPKETKTSFVPDFMSSKDPPEERKIPNPDPISCNPKDILIDVRNLSKFIQQGRGDDAVRLTKQLISQGIHLEATSLKQFPNEEEFQINIQFDGNEYNINQNGGTIPMNVYPSTTIRELRAIFQAVYKYPSTNQYLFVNGKLAHDDSTMRDLNVGPNSLFVLFLLAYPKQFRAQGPWKCSACSSQNQQENLKCHICSASRMT